MKKPVKAWGVIDKEFPEHILFWYDNTGTPHVDIHFQKQEAIESCNKWKQSYHPKSKVVPIEIIFK